MPPRFPRGTDNGPSSAFVLSYRARRSAQSAATDLYQQVGAYLNSSVTGGVTYPGMATPVQQEINTLAKNDPKLIKQLDAWLQEAQNEGGSANTNQALGGITAMIINAAKIDGEQGQSGSPAIQVLANYISATWGVGSSQWKDYQVIVAQPNASTLLNGIYLVWANPKNAIAGSKVRGDPYEPDLLSWLLVNYAAVCPQVAPNPQPPFPPPPWGPGDVSAQQSPNDPPGDYLVDALDPQEPTMDGSTRGEKQRLQKSTKTSIPTWVWIVGGAVGGVVVIAATRSAF